MVTLGTLYLLRFWIIKMCFVEFSRTITRYARLVKQGSMLLAIGSSSLRSAPAIDQVVQNKLCSLVSKPSCKVSSGFVLGI